MIRSWIPGLIAATLAAPPASAAQGRAAELRGNPGQHFGANNYPPEALRLKQQGRVIAKLWVDDTGKVVSCTVTTSSGSTSLDQTTCAIALEKVSFQPALDRKGRPIAASFVLPVRWEMSDGPVDVALRPPPPVWEVEVTMSVDSTGIVQACASKIALLAQDPCLQTPVGSRSDFRWVRDGRPVGGTIKRTMRQEITVDP